MKDTHHLYELINSLGTVEYVGISCNPKSRYYYHTKAKPKSSNDCSRGKFYGRQDLFLHIVNTFTDRSEALRQEGELKSHYGFLWSEKEAQREAGRIAGRKNVESGLLRRNSDQMKGKKNKGWEDPDKRKRMIEGAIRGGRTGGLKSRRTK